MSALATKLVAPTTIPVALVVTVGPPVWVLGVIRYIAPETVKSELSGTP